MSKIVGELYDGVYYDIIENEIENPVKNGDGRFILKLREGQDDAKTSDIPEKIIFPWERAVMILSNPWDRITHYKDDHGEHYSCIIYDFVWIDIWADTVEELFNLICRLIRPDDKGIDLITESTKEKEKQPIK